MTADRRIAGLWLALLAAPIAPPLPAATLSFRPDRVVGGNPVDVTLVLDQAQRETATYSVAVVDPLRAKESQSVTVGAGQQHATFKLTLPGVAQEGPLEVAVSDPASRAILATGRLTVLPARLTALALQRSSAVGGTPGSATTATVALDGAAPPAGKTVQLFQQCQECQGGFPVLEGLPSSVVVPSGARTVAVSFQPGAVGQPRDVTLGATADGVTHTAAFRVETLRPISIAVSPGTVSGGQPATVTFTLNAPAYPNYTVEIACSLALSLNPPPLGMATCDPPTSPSDARVPVAAGQSTGSIAVTSKTLPSPQQVTISLRAGGLNDATSVQAVLTVVP